MHHINPQKSIIVFLIVSLFALMTASSYAHESRPIYVEIKETQLNHYKAAILIPYKISQISMPSLQLPKDCQTIKKSLMQKTRGGFIQNQLFLCQQSLANQKVDLIFPIVKPSVATLYRIEMHNGQKFSKLISANENGWEIPKKESAISIAADYSLLGIEHILFGFDHLLFIACLIFIARTLRRILITITGFTLAHSVTLILATLDVIRLPLPPVEAVIALSILFLAHEIAVSNRQSWTFQYPVLVATTFGFLHGLGFSAVLSDIGLPQTEKAMALLFFNLGVELGQLIFILIVISLYRIYIQFELFRYFNVNKRKIRSLSSYLIGSIAAFWLIQRLVLFTV